MANILKLLKEKLSNQNFIPVKISFIKKGKIMAFLDICKLTKSIISRTILREILQKYYTMPIYRHKENANKIEKQTIY